MHLCVLLLLGAEVGVLGIIQTEPRCIFDALFDSRESRDSFHFGIVSGLEIFPGRRRAVSLLNQARQDRLQANLQDVWINPT